MKALSIIRDMSSQHHLATWEPDCACSSSVLQISPTHLTQRINITELQLLDPIAYSPITDDYIVAHSPYSSQGSLLISKRIFNIIQEGERYLNELPKKLIAILISFGILGSVETKLVPVSSDKLEVWLHITNACNLDCSYCYVNKTRQHMSYETGLKAIETIFHSAQKNNFSRIKIKYAGGEPTLRFNFLKNIHKLAIKQSATTNIELDGILLTNGTLLSSKMADDIRDLNLGVAISIDGIEEFHDGQRPFVNGKGSFGKVRENLQLLLNKSLKPFVSITVTNQSARGLPDVVRWLLDHNLLFTLNFERYSTPFRINSTLEAPNILDALIPTIEIIEEYLPQTSLLDGLMDRANLHKAHSRTCGVGENYLVINHHGGISKCQMQVHQPIGQLNEHDPIMLVRSDKKGICNDLVDNKLECNSCTWRYWCSGGCPLQTYIATGKYNVKSPNCDIYMAIFPKMLRLEGLRLLKYGSEQIFD